MRRSIHATVAFLLASIVACGDSTGPETSFESIAGTYDGVLGGFSQGVALDATFSLTINQASGTATGSWALQGTLDDGFDFFDVQGSGSLSGSVSSGEEPLRQSHRPNRLVPALSGALLGKLRFHKSRAHDFRPDRILCGRNLYRCAQLSVDDPALSLTSLRE